MQEYREKTIYTKMMHSIHIVSFIFSVLYILSQNIFILADEYSKREKYEKINK
jgi:hypothetical protein